MQRIFTKWTHSCNQNPNQETELKDGKKHSCVSAKVMPAGEVRSICGFKESDITYQTWWRWTGFEKYLLNKPSRGYLHPSPWMISLLDAKFSIHIWPNCQTLEGRWGNLVNEKIWFTPHWHNNPPKAMST